MSRNDDRGSPTLPPRSHALDLVCERFYLREVLRSLVQTVLFNRLLFAASHTRPREVEMNALDFAYVAVDDPEVDRVVEERLSHFVRLVDAASPSSAAGTPSLAATQSPSSSVYGGPPSTRRNSYFQGIPGTPVVRSSLTVAFSERRSKKSWFAGSYDEDVVWEEWNFSIVVKNSKTDREHEQSKRALEEELPMLLMKVAALANENRDAVPKLTSPPTPALSESTTGSALGANPFPWSIAVGSATQGTMLAASDPPNAALPNVPLVAGSEVPPARPSGYILDEDTEFVSHSSASGSGTGRGTSWTSLLKRVVSDTASVAGLGSSLGMGGLSR